jgi:uracil-DNA glycosylase family 4
MERVGGRVVSASGETTEPRTIGTDLTKTRKHPLAACESCPFQDAPFVPTFNLRPKSRLAVIGEAPGAYEAARGIPFTGPSGRLLDQVLNHHGYEREEVMLSNVCLCRPEGNADPPKTAIAACKPRLDAEIAASGVDSILAVGGTAASSLIDPKKKITNLRIGGPKPYLENPEIKVIATWHPAYCLRVPDAFPSFVSDAGKIRARNSKYGKWKWGTYKFFDSPEVTLEVIRRLWIIDGPFVIDIETGFDKDETYDHPDHYDLLCIGISYDVDKVVVIGENALQFSRVQDELGKLLRVKGIVGHNIKSDIAGLEPKFGKIEAVGDTMLYSYIYDERPGLHGLEKLGVEIFGTPNWKSQFKTLVPKSKNYAEAPREELYLYNAKDVHVTRSLWDYFNDSAGEREQKLHRFLMQAANAVVSLEQAGITFDVEYSKKLQYELEAELFDLEVEMEDTTGRKINPRSPQQIVRWFEENGISLPTTEADYLQQIKPRLTDETQRTFIDQLLLHRRRAKLNGTYVKGFQKRIYRDKVYTTYTLHGTTSGRLASKNPNMQNIVRDKRIKHQFTVETPGNVLIQIDYKQAEGRVITHLAQDDYLASIFADPTRDIFDELTFSVYGHKEKEERVKIKSVFYGLAYGRGAAAIGIELGISLAEAQKLLADFKALIPKTVAWQASIKAKVLSGEDLVTPFGRKRSFWLITDQNKSDVLNEALSFMPQSIASDITLSALIQLQPRLRSLATTRLTIHDALIFECKEADSEKVIQIASEEMIQAGRRFTDFVPFTVDYSIGKRWSEL